MDKTFQGVNVNLPLLAQSIDFYLQGKGYHTQNFVSGNSAVVQAKKTGLLRTIFGANRAFTVRMTGGQGYLDVNIGLADWIVGTSVVEDVITYLVLTPLAVVEGVEELWNLEIERQVMSEIERLIGTGQVTMQGYPNQPYQQNPYQQPYQYNNPYNNPYQQPNQGYTYQRNCPSCSSPLPPNARFCPSCGYKLY
jgi:cytochrome c biogenesis protein ResB